MTKLSLPRALSDPPPHHRSCPLYYLYRRSLVDHPWTDSNEYRIATEKGGGEGGERKGGGGWTRKTVCDGQISGRDCDDESRRWTRRRKNFVSINNSGPVLNGEGIHPPPSPSFRLGRILLFSLLSLSFPPPCRNSFVSSVKEGRGGWLEGGSKNLIFS